MIGIPDSTVYLSTSVLLCSHEAVNGRCMLPCSRVGYGGRTAASSGKERAMDVGEIYAGTQKRNIYIYIYIYIYIQNIDRHSMLLHGTARYCTVLRRCDDVVTRGVPPRLHHPPTDSRPPSVTTIHGYASPFGSHPLWVRRSPAARRRGHRRDSSGPSRTTHSSRRHSSPGRLFHYLGYRLSVYMVHTT